MWIVPPFLHISQIKQGHLKRSTNPTWWPKATWRLSWVGAGVKHRTVREEHRCTTPADPLSVTQNPAHQRGALTSLFSLSRPPNLVSCLTFPDPLSSPLSIFSPCGRKFSNFSKKILFFLIQYVKLAVKGSSHATSNCYVHCGLHTSLVSVFGKDIDPSFPFSLVLLASLRAFWHWRKHFA